MCNGNLCARKIFNKRNEILLQVDAHWKFIRRFTNRFVHPKLHMSCWKTAITLLLSLTSNNGSNIPPPFRKIKSPTLKKRFREDGEVVFHRGTDGRFPDSSCLRRRKVKWTLFHVGNLKPTAESTVWLRKKTCIQPKNKRNLQKFRRLEAEWLSKNVLPVWNKTN